MKTSISIQGGSLPLAFNRLLRILATVLLLHACSAAVAATTTIVKGRIVYGSVIETAENDLDDATASVFNRGLAPGEPIPHVTVALRNGWLAYEGEGEVLTDGNGEFSITVDGTPDKLVLVTKAKNDYVKVRKFGKGIVGCVDLDDVLKTETDVRENLDLEGGTEDLGDILVVSDVSDTYDIDGVQNYVSRGLYICGVAQVSAENIRALTGETLPSVNVRLGIVKTDLDLGSLIVNLANPGAGAIFQWFFPDSILSWPPAESATAFYWQPCDNIYLASTDAETFYHEYGHFIQDKLTAFALIPCYGSHGACKQMETTLTDNPNLCWAWLEGFATWLGAVNSASLHGWPADVTCTGQDWDGDNDADEYDVYLCERATYLLKLGYAHDIEGNKCSSESKEDWSDPRAVESVVANVLWDLIDSAEEPPDDTFIDAVPEIARVPVADVLEVIRKNLGDLKDETGLNLDNNPCGLLEFNSRLMGLDQFWLAWRALHPGPVPDLYSAYARNHVALDDAVDFYPPYEVTLTSSTHEQNVWSNDPRVTLTVVDGYDDVSGSYYYSFQVTETSLPDASFDVDTDCNQCDKCSKETQFDYELSLNDGDSWYIHARSRDLAGHLDNRDSYYGPIKIDTVQPYWIPEDLTFAIEDLYLIGTYVHFEWDAGDALSGVSHIDIVYSDPVNGIAGLASLRTYGAKGSVEYYLNPDLVLPTTGGRFTVTVYDVAGNSLSTQTEEFTVVSPFDGPNDLALPLDHGRVVSGDLNGDGKDEIVISGKTAGPRVLQMIQVSPALLVQDLVPGIGVAGGDLFLADMDRDGDLDLIAAGDFGGGGPEIYRFQNNGAGAFVSLGALAIPTFSDIVVRVVDLYGTGEPILVYGGRMGAGAANQQLRAYPLQSGGPVQLLTGTFFRGGDFEVGDINADGLFDFVTLSYDATGSGSVQTYLGTSQENQLSWVAGTGTSAEYPEIGDVDLGNWDFDNGLEFFKMYQSTIPTGVENNSELWEWTGSGYVLAIAAGTVNRIAEGDGHIVDVYADGQPDVFALGRTLSGGLSSWYVTNERLGQKGTGVPYPVRAANLLYETDTAWGDFDNDGDLDVVITGTTGLGTRRTVWYENKVNVYSEPNDDPPAPINLQSVYDAARGGYVLSWNAPGANTDETVEAAFEYEIRVGNAPGASDIVSWAHHAGHGQQVAPAFVAGRFERFVPMPAGVFDWCVRAVDSGWRRSGCLVPGPGAFADGLPPETIVAGTTPPYVSGGALHLTDAIGGQANYWITPLSSRTVQSVSAQWKTYIGGGGDTNNGGFGADGLSFSIGTDLGTSFAPEEGAATGLSVMVDTYNNGGSEVGLEIKWNGQQVAFTRSGDGENSPSAKAPLRQSQFLDTTLEVSPTGTVTFSYAGLSVSGSIPNYSGIVADQYVFAARTGGQFDNHWIDDVSVHLGEASGIDLSVAISPLTTQITEGDTLSITLTTSNAGPSTATGVELTTTIPAGLTLQSATASQGSCQLDANAVTCSFGPLGGNQTATAQLVLIAQALRPGTPEFENLGDLSCMVNSSGTDPNPTNDLAALPIVVFTRRDFGAAPNPPYLSCLPDGARHRVVAGYSMGPRIDSEADCQTDDNTDALADEDGVTFVPPPPWWPGTVVTPTVVVSRPASMTAVLDAWLDADGIAGFHTADRIYTGALLPVIGANILPSFTVPASAPIAFTHLRLRMSQTGVAGPGGYAPDGEVEDYQVEVVPDLRPTVALISPTNGSSFPFGMPISLVATATAATGQTLVKVEFVDQNRKFGESTSSPYSLTLSGLANGTYTLSAVATDSAGLARESSPVTIWVGNPQGILREWFLGIQGDTVATLTNDPAFPDGPSGNSMETLFEGPRNFGDNYGTRFRGYVLPPVTGPYTFWIAGDDGSQLYLSTDELPANKVVIAGVAHWDNSNAAYYREWDRDSRQQSAAIILEAGRRYYIEALHKEGAGDDHISVGWELPDGTLERPIPGNRLNPWVNDSLPDLQLKSVASILVTENIAANLTITVSNPGPATATAVQLTGNAPAGLRFLSAISSAGSCQLQGNSNVVCSVQGLNSNSAFAVTLTARANFLPPQAGEFENLADLTFITSSTESDLNLADNSLILPVTVHAQTDWGDARGGGFPVTPEENGARHRYSPTAPWLGVRWDNDERGNHSPNADFDDTHGAAPDDEDGIEFTSPLVPGTTATVTVICRNAPGFLNAWADFYANTNWSDAGEQIFAGVPLAVGSNTLTFIVPADAVAGTTTTRWRVSTNGFIIYNGHAGFGEVEDHTNTIQALPVDVAVSLHGFLPEPDLVGTPVRYTATVSNAGSNIAAGVSLVLTHQAQAFSDIRAQSAQASCQVTGGEVRCALSSMAPGATSSVEITATPQMQGRLSVRAQVAAAIDVDPADNVVEGFLPAIFVSTMCDCDCDENMPATDPALTSWFTKNSGQWARAMTNSGSTAVTTWPTSHGSSVTAVDQNYADVQRIDYSAPENAVYISSEDLASYVMGPWFCDPDIADLFDNWPAAQGMIAAIPRNLDTSACDNTPFGKIGLWVNGTAIYNFLDGFYFVRNPSPGMDVSPGAPGSPPGTAPGPSVWNRNAYWSEKITFDPGGFHSANNQYHSHASPKLLRAQLGDNQWPIYGPSDELLGYVEQPNSNLWQHSPILGWAFDGHPIYGPYGYSDPTNAASAIRRMRSGYVLRNGAHNTTDVREESGETGRTTLPMWAKLLAPADHPELVDETDYGPRSARTDIDTFCNDIEWGLGRYVEDYAYLGHLFKDTGVLPVSVYRVGEDFDLDVHNGRCCVTPEFPEGTYAYFVAIDEDGQPAFPYITGWQYCGIQGGGEKNNIPSEGVTTYFKALHPRMTPGGPRIQNGVIQLQWDSREGGDYRVWVSDNLQNWTEVSPVLPSEGTTTTYTYDPGPNPRTKQFFKVTLERDNGQQQQ